MIDGLKPYPAYNRGEIPWLDKTPATWEKRRLKTLFLEVDDRSKTGQEKLLSLRMHRGLVGHIEVGGRPIPPSALVGFKKTAPGQLVMNRMRAMSGLFAVTPEPGLVSPDYAVFDVREGANPSYFSELFKSPQMLAVFRAESKGLGTGESGFLRLYSDRFGVIPVAVPPPDEQVAIVKFLDNADRRIRRYIRIKQKLIKLLEEQKRVVIQQAVTRGLDPNVRLKPSGVEWLGDVPEHWELRAVGSAAASVQTGPFGSQVHSSDYVRGGVPLINPTHITGGRIIPDADVAVSSSKAAELCRHQLGAGDVVVSRRGELGRCAVVEAEASGWLCGTGSLRIRLKSDGFSPRYFALLFASQGVSTALAHMSLGATMPNLNAGMVASLRLPCPPIAEQEFVLHFIGKLSCSIDNVLCKIHRECELLREFRTGLISDVVTGKVNVRQVAASLRDEPTIEDEPIEGLDDDTTDDELDLGGEESDE